MGGGAGGLLSTQSKYISGLWLDVEEETTASND